MITRDSFIVSLHNVSDVNAHYAFIDRHAKQGDREALKAIFAELHKELASSDISYWASAAVLERIIEALALTGEYDNAVAALDLAALAQTSAKRVSVRLCPPAIASKIVAAHSPEVIDTLLLKLSDLETCALVLHEAVVRRKLLSKSSVPREVQNRLASTRHPLASLPLTLFDFEEAVLLPNYRVGSSATAIPFGPYREQPAFTPTPVADNLELAETTQPERANQISAAVVNWKEESNGKIEARTFRLNLPRRDMLPAIIPYLGVESVRRTDQLHARENVALKDVFTVLFSAASSGGAYNIGNFAAYGRFLAWRSIAGLVGAPLDAPARIIAASARTCQWCLFDSASEWYHQVAWDIGVACYNPGGQEVALLAATDTD